MDLWDFCLKPGLTTENMLSSCWCLRYLVKAALWWDEVLRAQRTEPSDLGKKGYFQIVVLQCENSQLASSLWPSWGQRSGRSEGNLCVCKHDQIRASSILFWAKKELFTMQNYVLISNNYQVGFFSLRAVYTVNLICYWNCQGFALVWKRLFLYLLGFASTLYGGKELETNFWI